jgi:MFS transporter, BCD family, chlorophyll transporter
VIAAPLGWFGIVRLGLVQSAIGMIMMLSASLLNRVMVVEYAQVAALPAGLVGLYHAVQLSRPKWGHGSDIGWRRTPLIIGGMAVLALGGVLATQATLLLAGPFWPAFALMLLAYAMIGVGVGAAGTSLLALLATRTAPARRPAAASLVWIMMILGIVVASKLAGDALEPFTPGRLMTVAVAVAAGSFILACLGVVGIEGRAAPADPAAAPLAPDAFGIALRGIWADPVTRLFSVFVFVSMLAYSMQDLILEPFSGLVFGLTPGASTRLSGVQHQGVFIGMVLVGLGGHAFGGRSGGFAGLNLKRWIVGGCVGSALALVGLAMAARVGPGWPLAPTVFALGFANGVFAVAAIGSMLDLAGRGGADGTSGGLEGIRMGLWGAAQAAAFGIGGFFGASAVDAGRALLGADGPAFEAVFALEAVIFLFAAALAARLTNDSKAVNKLEALA